jgi:manganese-dependent ADP-ribose/CDP-alcohol diphosphatase
MRVIIVCIFIILNLQAEENFKIAVLADCQYCNKSNRGSRMYNTSDQRLKEFVKECNKHELKFAVQVGDLIDEKYESYEVILDILKDLKAPMYHVLGNHEFSVDPKLKASIPSLLKMPSKYYSKSFNNYRFIVLDGNDVSFHAYEKGSPEYLAAGKYYKENKIRSPKWNGAIGSAQMKWLKDQLELAESQKEKVVLFCHFPVYPVNNHNLWNSQEVKNLLESYSCVKAYINGHNHKGNYGENSGVHYLTMKGMVENKKPTFSIMELSKNVIAIKGFGAEKNHELKMK